MTDQDQSKAQFFEQLSAISSAMIEAHGRHFAIGALLLAARYIAENAPSDDPAAAEGAAAQAASAAAV